MDHGLLLGKGIQHDEVEVVIGCHIHDFARVGGIFGIMAFGIDIIAQHQWFLEPAAIPFGADRHLEKIWVGFRQVFIIVEADDDATGLVLDGRKACGVDKSIYLIESQFRPRVAGAVVVGVCAILFVEIAGHGIADAETG